MKKEISPAIFVGVAAVALLALGVVVYLALFRTTPDSFPTPQTSQASGGGPGANRPSGYAPAGPPRPAAPRP